VLKEQNKFGIGDVEGIDVGVTRYTYDKLCYLEPKTGLEGKFSMPYTVARSLLDDTIGLETYTDKFVADPAAQELTRRVKMYVHDGIERAWKGGSRPVHVRIRLRGGRALERQVDISKGNPEVPMTAKELSGKFADCARQSLSLGDITAAAKAVEMIESLRSISDLTIVLAGQTSVAAA
jgi:2-methylcitrate dehydratase PrpD